MPSSPKRTQKERRAKPRIYCDYPAIIRVHDPKGKTRETQAVLANLSASGMYLRLGQYVDQGDKVFIMVRMSNATSRKQDMSKVPNIAAKGEVLRVEPIPDGAYGVAVRLKRYRLL